MPLRSYTHQAKQLLKPYSCDCYATFLMPEVHCCCTVAGTATGGTFAVYSLLCRSIGITPFGSEVDKADVELSRYSSVHVRKLAGLQGAKRMVKEQM